jgi:sec-independent protein translocase protein TatB
MFDVGWSEMALVLLVALIVIGPKDLPRVARTMGQWVGKGRAMAREFQRALEDMAREAELDKVKSEIEKAGRTNVGKTIENTIDPSGELSKAFDPKAGDPKAGSGPASSGKRANGDQPASADAQPAKAPSARAAPAKPPESLAPAGNGTDGAKERKGRARKSAPAAPAKSAPAAPAKPETRAPAGNGAAAAEDRNEPARDTAPAEPN